MNRFKYNAPEPHPSCSPTKAVNFTNDSDDAELASIAAEMEASDLAGIVPVAGRSENDQHLQKN